MRRSQVRSLPTFVEVQGNNGGSYVRLAASEAEGMCVIEVGETCVVTVREEVPVAWLAMILTAAGDLGFRAAAEQYVKQHGYDPDFMDVR